MTKYCFVCNKKLGKNPAIVDTRDDQWVYIGRECFKHVVIEGITGERIFSMSKYGKKATEKWRMM